MALQEPPPPRPDWLRLTAEEPLEPGLPVCDSHHHLWDHGPGDRYLLEEMLDDTGSGHNVVSTVFVDCHSMYRSDGPAEMKPVGETEFANGIAAMSASGHCGATRIAAGIVGRADLGLGAAVAPVLEAHLAAGPRFRGIRHWLNWQDNASAFGLRSDAPPGQAFDAKFREGYACLGRYALSFDAWLYFHQLPDLVDLARAFPDIPVVLNHAGGVLGVGPHAGRDEAFRLWQRNIAEVARCPNVFVKLGGLGVPRCGFGWHERSAPPTSLQLAEAFAPYVLYCIEQFGPQRSMFESNFPADKIACSYTVLWNCFKRLTRGFSATERSALFHGTAVRIYRLNEA
ncbi:MAG: amidohydrolase [Betaproteobacteria bacterium RIFCSPLOWO2_02_FULL_65_24]|nr:MAG: amidohydrolase [Betaproteobacteria bacterium RIFCSPLOWO2_02_FULL_65_24]OGA79903.1 MAG: amidohydrolase [Betaproteobacteria bacterium RIFCSPLOWO2_12_FULL_66_14]